MTLKNKVAAVLVQSWIDEANGPRKHRKLMYDYLDHALETTAQGENNLGMSEEIEHVAIFLEQARHYPHNHNNDDPKKLLDEIVV
jgi:hypothetical protein